MVLCSCHGLYWIVRVLRLMEIARPTNVVVEQGEAALRDILRQGLFVQLVFQDGINGGVADGVGGTSSATSSFDPLVPVVFAQADNARSSPERLLGMRLAFDQRFDQLARVLAN